MQYFKDQINCLPHQNQIKNWADVQQEGQITMRSLSLFSVDQVTHDNLSLAFCILIVYNYDIDFVDMYRFSYTYFYALINII